MSIRIREKSLFLCDSCSRSMIIKRVKGRDIYCKYLATYVMDGIIDCTKYQTKEQAKMDDIADFMAVEPSKIPKLKGATTVEVDWREGGYL